MSTKFPQPTRHAQLTENPALLATLEVRTPESGDCGNPGGPWRIVELCESFSAIDPSLCDRNACICPIPPD